jgi:hypothetical protein
VRKALLDGRRGIILSTIDDVQATSKIGLGKENSAVRIQKEGRRSSFEVGQTDNPAPSIFCLFSGGSHRFLHGTSLHWWSSSTIFTNWRPVIG